MHLTLSPQAGLPGHPAMTLHVAGEVLTIDGLAIDLSAVPEGGEGWPDQPGPLLGPILRRDGILHVTIVLRLQGGAPTDGAIGPWVIPEAEGPVMVPASGSASADGQEGVQAS